MFCIVRLIDGYEIQDAISDSYSDNGKEDMAIIVRSNKRANIYNQQIRNRILFNEHELSAGDYLMVVKNNYFWLPATSEAGFIANGDIIEVLEIFSIKELYGFRFAEVNIRMGAEARRLIRLLVVVRKQLARRFPRRRVPWRKNSRL